MAVVNVPIVNLWRQLRGIENACRYYSDLMAAVIAMPGIGLDHEITVDEMTAAPLDDPWPNFCRPPHCKKLAPNLSEELGRMGTRLQAVASIVNLVLPDLPRGTDEIRFYASEIPGTFWPSVPGPPSLP